ncbi:death-associated protein 1 [Aplysia californica]|uniref:Death-associated protein 1 n=1 Tax=Aplysia californica TaxID=6500 RepID=A0ABM0JGI4_APLCA|nr:death-associated protein 1 [Aplysia californica]
MSAPDEGANPELKGGHAPAVKVGGMRVVQHKKEGEKQEPTQMTAEEEAEFGASPPKTDKHHQSMLVSGAVTKGDKDFTTQAVKSIHEKPVPTHDPKPRPNQNTHQIHQPR